MLAGLDREVQVGGVGRGEAEKPERVADRPGETGGVARRQPDEVRDGSAKQRRIPRVQEHRGTPMVCRLIEPAMRLCVPGHAGPGRRLGQVDPAHADDRQDPGRCHDPDLGKAGRDEEHDEHATAPSVPEAALEQEMPEQRPSFQMAPDVIRRPDPPAPGRQEIRSRIRCWRIFGHGPTTFLRSAVPDAAGAGGLSPS